jgi:hypothetical protein
VRHAVSVFPATVTLTAVILALVTVAAPLAACKSAERQGPTNSTSPASTPAVPRPGSTASDAGSAANPRAILCEVEEAHVDITFDPGRDDVVVGPFLWPSLRRWATANPADRGEGNRYKLGVELKARSVVTVTVAPEARSIAGLTYGQRWSYTPAESVTFHACPNADTAFIGGFEVREHRCVPFDVTVGDAPPVRVVVSFFTGAPCG